MTITNDEVTRSIGKSSIEVLQDMIDSVVDECNVLRKLQNTARLEGHYDEAISIEAEINEKTRRISKWKLSIQQKKLGAELDTIILLRDKYDTGNYDFHDKKVKDLAKKIADIEVEKKG